MPTATVLVTGASGFIAKHCIAELLRNDFSVRGTLRDLTRADAVRKSVARAGADACGVDFVTADLLSDDGWQMAMEDCTFVLHVASPFPLQEPRHPDDVIRPAREGALRVLKAATQAGVKRVVMTSSVVSVTMPWPEAPLGHVFTEADWTNPERPDITTYIRSKTLAELAAWDYVKNEPRAPELAAVNPAIVLGPATDSDISSSHEVIKLMAKGAYPAAPRGRLSHQRRARRGGNARAGDDQARGSGQALPHRERLPAANRGGAPRCRCAPRPAGQGAPSRATRFARAGRRNHRPAPEGGDP